MQIARILRISPLYSVYISLSLLLPPSLVSELKIPSLLTYLFFLPERDFFCLSFARSAGFFSLFMFDSVSTYDRARETKETGDRKWKKKHVMQWSISYLSVDKIEFLLRAHPLSSGRPANLRTTNKRRR